MRLKKKIFLMNMSHTNNTSGVDRYIETLLRGLFSHRERFDLYWICLVNDPGKIISETVKCDCCTKIIIPLPQYYKGIIVSKYFMNIYCEHIFRMIRHLFDNRSENILHIHTLNLIDLALLIKKHFHSKIITHLHCIPWKGFYDTNKKKFELLYSSVYKGSPIVKSKVEDFLTHHGELDSYLESDNIICVTESSCLFLTNILRIDKSKIIVINNGIQDYYVRNRRFTQKNELVKLLYVGIVNESKGLLHIVEAIRKVVSRTDLKISLIIAGRSDTSYAYKIRKDYQELDLNFLGKVPFVELKKYYNECDIGIISSLQEQCSYVAIEMSMFGLPIITTAVDGLDEMFTDGINSLKVNTTYSYSKGLGVNVDLMADNIELLSMNAGFRKKLSKKSRELYLSKYTIDEMLSKTVDVYDLI